MSLQTPPNIMCQALDDMKKIDEQGKTEELVKSNAFKDFQTELKLCLGDNAIDDC